ncbi:MAG TPA: cyclase family protein [Trebonia sp.]|nr:cyclase family protein [Trebonia sp.]
MSVIDLSLPVRTTSPGVQFEQWRHEDGAARVSKNTRSLPGDDRMQRARNYVGWLAGTRRIRKADLPGGDFLSNEFYRMSVHQATHVDAPYHYGPTCEGAPAKKIGDLPLDWFVGEGVVLDVRGCGETVSAPVVKRAIKEAHHEPGKGTIVLLRSDADLKFGTPAYFRDFPGIEPDAIDLLTGLGVKVIGTDGWGFDRPVPKMVRDFYRTGDAKVLWPAHLHGRTREFIQIEGMANLRSIPFGTFQVIALPIRLIDAGGAWTRAVAIPDPHN